METVNTAKEGIMTTDTTTYVFGQISYGGKIHRTEENGHAWCMSGNGHKPIRSIFAKVTHLHNGYQPNFAKTEAEVEAIKNAGIGTDNLCQKCCDHIIREIEEAGA